MVKRFMRARSQGCICPPDMPVCGCGRVAEGALLAAKAQRPRQAELDRNPRARSALLRGLRRAERRVSTRATARAAPPRRPRPRAARAAPGRGPPPAAPARAAVAPPRPRTARAPGPPGASRSSPSCSAASCWSTSPSWRSPTRPARSSSARAASRRRPPACRATLEQRDARGAARTRRTAPRHGRVAAAATGHLPRPAPGRR